MFYAKIYKDDMKWWILEIRSEESDEVYEIARSPRLHDMLRSGHIGRKIRELERENDGRA